MSWLPLTNGSDLGGTWGEAFARLQATVDAIHLDDLALQVSSSNSRMTGAGPLRINIDRVILGSPQWVAWIATSSARLLGALATAGWLIWEADKPPSFRHPDMSLKPSSDFDGRTLVGTWRSDTPFEISRAVIGTLDECLKRVDLGQVRVTWIPASKAEIQRRESIDERIRGLSNRSFHGFMNPVKGYCHVCGQPLRDAVSIKRGVGPICWRLVGELDLDIKGLRADIPAHYWARAKTEKAWRKSFIRRLNLEMASRGPIAVLPDFSTAADDQAGLTEVSKVADVLRRALVMGDHAAIGGSGLD
jgi:hypothetical protein